MQTISENTLTLDGRSSPWPIYAIIAACALIFFFVEHNLRTSASEMYGTTADVLESRAAAGQMLSQVGIALLALLGVVCMATGPRRTWAFHPLLIAAIVFYVGWSTLSVVWSVDKGLTIRRIGALYCCIIGAMGLSRRLSLYAMGVTVLSLSGLYLAIGFAAELALGTFRPWNSDYRFSGTLHPNAQGIHLAYLGITSVLLMTYSKRKAPLLALLAVSLVFLVLTKSRTSLATMLAALAVIGLCRASAKSFVATALGIATIVSAVVFAVECAGPQVVDDFESVIMLGRKEHAGSFSGRTDLWEEMVQYAGRQPLVGYGYRSFWTPTRIEQVSGDLYWSMSSAHSLYLDTLLTLGVVGLMALLFLGFLGFGLVARRYRQTGYVGYGVMMGLMLCGAISGLLESAFLAPSLESCMSGCGLSLIAFYGGRSAPADASAQARTSPLAWHPYSPGTSA